jgi:hypothetical protein
MFTFAHEEVSCSVAAAWADGAVVASRAAAKTANLDLRGITGSLA